jgi:hypothetical protein
MSISVIPPVVTPLPSTIPVLDTVTDTATVGESKFKIFYQKPKNDSVLKDLEMSYLGLKNCQNYIPIYSKFFSLNDTNYNSINLNQKYKVKSILAPTDSDNVVKNFGNAIIHPNHPIHNNSTPIFFKYSPLLDPIKYLAGNYNFKKNTNGSGGGDGVSGGDILQNKDGDSRSYLQESLLKLPSFHSKPFAFDSVVSEHVVEEKEKYNHYKILDANNSAYVDGFFSYLSSQLLNTHGFIHGIDFYGAYLAIQNEFTINIIDDYEYLMKNDYFKEKNGILFKFDEKVFEECNDSDDEQTGGHKKTSDCSHHPKLNIQEMGIQFDVDVFDDVFDVFDNSCKNENGDKEEKCNNNAEPTDLIELTDSNFLNLETGDKLFDISCNSSSDVSCSSRSSHTTTDGSTDDDGQDENDDEDSEGSEGSVSSSSSNSSNTESTFETIDDDEEYEEEETLNAVIYNFPVEVIMLERCTKTLDYLMVKDILSDEEWEAALMQVVITLATYQKIFSFTHNDLHTNNIMFIETDKKYIYYFFNKKYYKVPTFGRIFKIIDFGRSIYRFNSTLICSDSFHKSGDAATQYNCEPYFNEKKPCIEPNYSFDLCRLGCSLFDFFIDDMEDVARECKKSRLVSLIVDWVTDDEGRNILYKKNGVDRYPDFKLYKMIARTVHNKVPSQQLKQRIFAQYEVTQKNIKNVSKTEIMNIDDIPIYACG